MITRKEASISYQDMAERAMLLPVRRVMFRCKNKQCKHAWARDYAVIQSPRPSQPDTLYRVSPDAIMMLRDDSLCPVCNGTWIQTTALEGVHVAHKPCDDRCVNAANSICHCSCGGKNHGGGILL